MSSRSPAPVQNASTLATAVVPWTEHYEFDADSFIFQVRTIAQDLTRHIYLFGTAVEGYAVGEKRFDRIARAFWESSQANQVSPMLGVISLSMPTIVDRIRRGHALGYRAFQLSLPSRGALNEREPLVFFAETCGRFPDCHFQHFDLLRTKRLQASVEHRRLAAIHPDFAGVKAGTSDPAVVAALLSVSARLRFFFTQLGYAIARRTHETGLLISLASVNYKRSKQFVAGDDAHRAADAADFRVMGAALREVSADRFHIDGPYDKMLFRMTDPEFPLRPHPPYASATDKDFARFKAALPAGRAPL